MQHQAGISAVWHHRVPPIYLDPTNSSADITRKQAHLFNFGPNNVPVWPPTGIIRSCEWPAEKKSQIPRFSRGEFVISQRRSRGFTKSKGSMKRYPFIVKAVEPWDDDNAFEGMIKGSIGRMEISARYVLNPEELAKYPVGSVEEVLFEIEVSGGNLQVVDEEERFLEQGDGHNYTIQGKVIDMNDHSMLVRANIDMAVAIDEFPPVTELGQEIEVGDMIWVYGEMNIVFDPDSFENPFWE
jgi:hypothetical protein